MTTVAEIIKSKSDGKVHSVKPTDTVLSALKLMADMHIGALLVMGIAGGAIIPQLFAVLKQHIDFQLVFVLLMVPCYLYILFYSLRGHRVGQAGAGQ